MRTSTTLREDHELRVMLKLMNKENASEGLIFWKGLIAGHSGGLSSSSTSGSH
jgi:hypothetical protein